MYEMTDIEISMVPAPQEFVLYFTVYYTASVLCIIFSYQARLFSSRHAAGVAVSVLASGVTGVAGVVLQLLCWDWAIVPRSLTNRVFGSGHQHWSSAQAWIQVAGGFCGTSLGFHIESYICMIQSHFQKLHLPTL